jgi:hypothetical protein
MYYYNNPNIYANYLIQVNNMTDNYTTVYDINEIKHLENTTENQLYLNSTLFKLKFDNMNVSQKDCYYYTYYNYGTDTVKSQRIFVNYLVFGLMQLIAGIFAFNLRLPKYDWLADMTSLFYVIHNI